ncbi:MAG: hypothetical protein PHR06_11190 [Candidatus Cloacimonetes bacterium]|nr:hypothetical protein [Candidatus Cloacimonadota bacterium]
MKTLLTITIAIFTETLNLFGLVWPISNAIFQDTFDSAFGPRDISGEEGL